MTHVAIRCTYNDFDLRRELLLFDRIALPFLEATIEQWATSGNPRWESNAADLEWLANRDIVFVPSEASLEAGEAAADYREYLRIRASAAEDVRRLSEYLDLHGYDGHPAQFAALATRYYRETGYDLFDYLDRTFRNSFDYLARSLAVEMSRDVSTSPLAIMSGDISDLASEELTRVDVLNIALAAIPLPAADSPLESVLEFRGNPDVRADYLALHRWASTAAASTDKPGAVFAEVEYLAEQYRRHMRVHRIEQSESAFETIVTSAAEVLEDLVKFKWGHAAKSLFALKKRKVALLKAETVAPGREVAYLVKATSSMV